MYRTRFKHILDEFRRTPACQELALGEPVEAKLVYHFERPFSVQRVFRLEGPAGSVQVYVKLFKNAYNKSPEKFAEAIQRDFDTNLFWYQKLAPLADFSTIRPLYCSLPLQGIITLESPGINLGELTVKQLRFRPSAETLKMLQTYMHKAGRLLRIIQDFPVEAAPYDLRRLIEDVDSRMREFVENPAGHFPRKLRDRILQFYQDNLPGVSSRELPVTYLHRDFMMGNLLVNGREIVVHDFSRITTGPGLHDLTRFYHHVELLKYKPIYAGAAVSLLQHAFLGGFGGQVGPNDLLFRFFLIRHYITHFKGLLKREKRPLKARLYNRWVKTKHLENLWQLVGEATHAH